MIPEQIAKQFSNAIAEKNYWFSKNIPFSDRLLKQGIQPHGKGKRKKNKKRKRGNK